MKVYHTLKPIYNNNSKILILGSMPSVVSRANNFYYDHPSNRFWQILESLFKTKLLTHKDKEEFLLTNGIALWDVFKEAEIKGSSDASIKKYSINDLSLITKNSNIKAIFCTGKTAYNTLIKQYITNIPIYYLPSPSSANAAFSLDKLINEYQIILNYLK